MKMSDPLPRSKSNVTNNRATQTRDAKSSFSRSHCNCNRTTQDPSKLEWIDWQTKMVQRLEKKYSKSVDYKRYVKNSEARSSSFSNQLGLESSYNAPANLHSCSSTTYPFHRYGSLSSLQTAAQQMQPHMQSLQQQLPPMNQQMHPIHQVQPLQHQMSLQQHNQQQQELQAMHQQQQLSHILQSQQQNQQLQDLQTFQPQLQPLHQLPPLQQQSLSHRSMPHICLSQQHLQQPLPPIQQQLQPIQQQRLSLLPHHTLSQQSVHQPLQQTLHQQMQAPRHQQMQAHQQQESSLLLQQELQQQQQQQQQQMQPVGGHHAHHVLRPVAPQQLPALRHDEFLAQFPPSLGHARRLHLPPPQLPLRPSFSVPVTTNTQQLHGQFETNPPCEPCPLYGTFSQCPSNSLYQQQYQPYQQNVLGPHNGIQATGDLRPAGVLPALAHEAGHRLRKAPFETRTVSRLSYVPMPFTREPAHRPAEALRLAVRVADGVGPAAAGASTVYARSYMPVGDVASCRRVSMRRSDNLPLTPVPATPLCKVRPPYQRRAVDTWPKALSAHTALNIWKHSGDPLYGTNVAGPVTPISRHVQSAAGRLSAPRGGEHAPILRKATSQAQNGQRRAAGELRSSTPRCASSSSLPLSLAVVDSPCVPLPY